MNLHLTTLEKDSQILTIVKQLIAKHAAYAQKSLMKNLIKKKRSARCISVTMITKLENRLSNELNPVTPTNTSKISFEIKAVIENVFKALFLKYKTTSWAKEDSREVHIVAIKQFWLDCFVCDRYFFGILYDALPNKIWINLQGFSKAIENAQQLSTYTVFSLRRYDKRSQQAFQMEKMICKRYLVFFSFLTVDSGPLLEKEKLLLVLSMANKKEKTQLDIWAERFIAGANKFKKVPQESISFDEFIAILMK